MAARFRPPVAFATFCTLLGLGLIIFGVTGAHNWVQRRRGPAEPRGVLVEVISDPRDAIAILMVRVALMQEEVSEPTRDVIEQLFRQRFDFDDPLAAELYEFAHSAALRIGDASMGRAALVKPLKKHLTLTQRQDAAAMLEVVADRDGGRLTEQQALIARVRQDLGV